MNRLSIHFARVAVHECSLFLFFFFFFQDNPMTLFLKAIHHSIVLLDFETGLELLKEFTVDISHFRIKDLAFFYSKEFILNMVSRCINSLLARPDLENSRKRRFLRILAESDLSSVDSCTLFYKVSLQFVFLYLYFHSYSLLSYF